MCNILLGNPVWYFRPKSEATAIPLRVFPGPAPTSWRREPRNISRIQSSKNVISRWGKRRREGISGTFKRGDAKKGREKSLTQGRRRRDVKLPREPKGDIFFSVSVLQKKNMESETFLAANTIKSNKIMFSKPDSLTTRQKMKRWKKTQDMRKFAKNVSFPPVVLALLVLRTYTRGLKKVKKEDFFYMTLLLPCRDEGKWYSPTQIF